MDIFNAISHRRSIRRFQDRPVPKEILSRLVELSRLYASGGNKQPIRYGIVSKKPLTDQIYQQLAWAMYLPDFQIAETQRPPAYIVLFRDDRALHSCRFDVGAAATTLMLAAEGFGLGTCCLGSFHGKALQELLGLAGYYVPELVIAVGYPDQESEIAPYQDSPQYYEDSSGVLHVPKHSLESVMIFLDGEDSPGNPRCEMENAPC